MLKTVFKAIIFLFVLGVGFFGYQFWKNSDIHAPKKIHNILYDLYWPDAHLSPWQRVKRLAYREVLWYQLKKHKKVQNIVERIVEKRHNIPDYVWRFIDAYQNLKDDALREKVEQAWWKLLREASPEMRRYLCDLRQTWLYVIYSTPLAYELAGIEPPAKPVIHDVALSLPESKLCISGDNIVHQDGEVDYLIVGSGPAGSVIAHELVCCGARVVMVEAGSFVKPLSAITEFDADLMELHNERRSDTGSLIVRNGATVGGGTTVNIDLVFSPQLPAIRRKLSLWMDQGYLPAGFLHSGPGDWQPMLEAEAWVCEKLYTRKVEESEINANNRLLKEGHPRAQTYSLNARKPTGKVGEVLKISSCEALLVPALYGGKGYKGHFSLVPDTHVEQIIFSQEEGVRYADGVVVRFRDPLNHSNVVKDPCNLKPDLTKPYVLKARHVIVCAGALGSAALLLRSSLNNPCIGRGIVVHPSMGVIGLFPQEINVHQGLSASVYAPGDDGAYFFEAMSAGPAFIAALHPGGGRDIVKTIKQYRHLGGFGLMLVDSPTSTNRVYMEGEKVQVHYQLSDLDKLTMKRALKKAITILFQQGAREVFIPTAENIYAKGVFTFFVKPEDAYKAVDRLQFADGLNFISSAHMQGSNKMGCDPYASVVSPNFKVWDVDAQKEIGNLYVCDSSVFPTSVGANPMQSTYTLAKRFVDRLLKIQPVF